MKFGSREPFEAYDPQRYIEIDLLSLHYITAVIAESESGQPISFRVLTSRDGIGWNSLPLVLNITSGTEVNVNKRATHVR